MAQRSEIKKATYEDKFERKWWVNNKAKRKWIKFTKANNNRKFRRLKNEELQSEVNNG